MTKRVAITLALAWAVCAQQTGGAWAADEQQQKSKPAATSVIGGNDNVPDRDKPAVAAKHLARMREINARMAELVEGARKSKDMVKLNGVNEKLTQAKGLLRLSEQAETTMEEALMRKDAEVVAHEFAKIAIACQRQETLLVESESVIGELATYAGSTVVEMEGELRSDRDPTLLAPNIWQVEMPAQVSPYQ